VPDDGVSVPGVGISGGGNCFLVLVRADVREEGGTNLGKRTLVV
jgi:hypothetical protein